MRRAALLLAILVGPMALARPPRPKAPPKPASLPNLPKNQLCALGLIPGYFNPQNLAEPPTISAPSAALIDFDTGEMLYGKNPDVKRYPASTTKIMTGLLFAENTKPTDTVVCNNPYIQDVGESSLFIQPGDTFTAQNLLWGFLLKSANDGGVVIAEHVAGSVPRFAELMTARAKEIGAKNTHFMNPHGLHNKLHFTTARDLGLIAREAMRNPRFEEAVSNPPRRTIERLNAAGQTIETVVQSKARKSFYDVFPGADGIKTGFTNPALHCFVGSATRGGRRLIAVVMAAPHNASGDTIPLLEWGFRRFPASAVALKGRAAGGALPVRGGASASVSAVAARNLRVATDALGGRKIETQVISGENAAPIRRGQVVGQIVATVNGKEIGRVPLEASAAVPRSVFRAAVRSPLAGVGVGLGVCGAGALALIGAKYGRSHARTHRS